jgi:hypothetical protein
VIVFRSSTKSEYKDLANATPKIMWEQTLLREHGVASPLMARLWYDNMGAKWLASNHVIHARTKHIEVDFHFVWEWVILTRIFYRLILPSGAQVANGFTKTLTIQQLDNFKSNLNLAKLWLVIEARGGARGGGRRLPWLRHIWSPQDPQQPIISPPPQS